MKVSEDCGLTHTMDIDELPIETDPSLSSVEKESWFNMTGDAKHLFAGSRKRTIVASLIDHPHYEERWYSLLLEDGGETIHEPEDDVPESAEAIIAVGGRLPIGCLTVKSKPRSNNHQSSVVNSKQIDPDAFN